MPKIIKRPDGRYYTSFQINGTRKWLYGHSQAEVKRKLDEAWSQAVNVGGLPDCGRRTVQDLIEKYLEATAPTLKLKTILDYRKLSRTHIYPAIGKTWLSKLTPEQLQAFYTSLQSKGLKRIPTHVHSLLHRALKMAVMWRWLPSNPTERVVRPKYKPARKEVWSLEEARTFFREAASYQFFPIYFLVAHSGCRLGELLGLHWDDVDWETDTISIRSNIQLIGKEWVEGDPKTYAGQRTIALDSEAMWMLNQVWVQQDEWRIDRAGKFEDRGLVFCTRNGHPVCQSNVELRLKRICEKLKIRHITPHQLRHLHASLLLDQKVPVPVVAERLGHSSPQITMRVYAHALKHRDREAAQVIGHLLSAPPDVGGPDSTI